jgi:hypothetical protein
VLFDQVDELAKETPFGERALQFVLAGFDVFFDRKSRVEYEHELKGSDEGWSDYLAATAYLADQHANMDY